MRPRGWEAPVTARRIVLAVVVLLALLHQDTWLWDDPTLVLGFLPAGLAWHVGLSLVAAGVWWAVTRFAWPEDPLGADASGAEVGR
ncbi:MAG: DUF3311 domain-containing protein [Alphaproteobacteria bacterium]|nr:DUF3311 domain-containing protein [Alphaproteobacteria bacterium]